MKMKYCMTCNKEVDIIENKESVKYHIQGSEINIDVCVPRCVECKSEISDAELFDINTALAKEAYVKQYNIVTFEELKKAMNDKSIDESELCEKCDISRIIFKKYSKGKLISKVDSDKIRKFLDI